MSLEHRVERLMRRAGIVAAAAIGPHSGDSAEACSRGPTEWRAVVEDAARMLGAARRDLLVTTLRVSVADHVIFVDQTSDGTVVAAVVPTGHESGKSVHRMIRILFRTIPGSAR